MCRLPRLAEKKARVSKRRKANSAHNILKIVYNGSQGNQPDKAMGENKLAMVKVGWLVASITIEFQAFESGL